MTDNKEAAGIDSPEWNVDTLLAYLAKHGADTDSDNEGQIVIYTGLYEREDGSLTTIPPEDE